MTTLKVTKEQLRLIQDALDMYSRIGIGQFEVIKDHPTFERNLKKQWIQNIINGIGKFTNGLDGKPNTSHTVL